MMGTFSVISIILVLSFFQAVDMSDADGKASYAAETLNIHFDNNGDTQTGKNGDDQVDNIERLRVCDPNKVLYRVKFASFPKCPTPTDYGDGERSYVGGTALTFKPNLYQVKANGHRCYIVRSVRRTVTNHIGMVSMPANWVDIDEKRPVSAETCRLWRDNRKCTVNTFHYRITDYYPTIFSSLPQNKTEEMELKLIKQFADNEKFYASKNEITAASLWNNIAETVTTNCFLETTTISSNAPYNRLVTTNGDIGVKERIFSLDDSLVTDTDTYVWKKPDPPRLCDYILHEVHRGNVVKQKMKNSTAFYLVLSEAKRSFYITPETQRIFLNDTNIYHTYCITTALTQFNKSEIYAMPYGMLVAYIPTEISVQEIHDEIASKAGENLRRSLPMKDRNDGEDDGLNEEEEMFYHHVRKKRSTKQIMFS